MIEKRSKQIRLIPNVQEAADIVGTALFVDGGCTTMMPGNA